MLTKYTRVRPGREKGYMLKPPVSITITCWFKIQRKEVSRFAKQACECKQRKLSHESNPFPHLEQSRKQTYMHCKCGGFQVITFAKQTSVTFLVVLCRSSFSLWATQASSSRAKSSSWWLLIAHQSLPFPLQRLKLHRKGVFDLRQSNGQFLRHQKMQRNPRTGEAPKFILGEGSLV